MRVKYYFTLGQKAINGNRLHLTNPTVAETTAAASVLAAVPYDAPVSGRGC
jgi:hypothetical protein